VGGLDPAKILVVLVIALIVLGPERLPSAARQLGGAWRELNRLREKFEEEVRSAVPDLDLPRIPTSPSRAVSGYLTGLVSGLTDTSPAGGTTTGATVSVSESVDSAAGLTSVSGSGGASWQNGEEPDEASPGWQPLLGSSEATQSRRVPSVPSWSSGGTLSADTVFLLDEPSMN
jgi:Sec-independent protein translocase protein TatA